MNIDNETIEHWATDTAAPVALHLRQTLTSVECIDPSTDKCIIYPPTYADIGYNIDEISGGTKVALVDSVGSHANRIEPVFICADDDRSRWLVPQIRIKINDDITISLLELAHRGADAVVRSAAGLSEKIGAAFDMLKKTGNAAPLCEIAPTSLLFGVWDSRGSNEKLPRLVRGIIRAWDVDKLHAAAQFNSVDKLLDDTQDAELVKATGKSGKAATEILSKRGFKDSPAVTYPKSGGRVLGGVLVKGGIFRDLTVNLVALRSLSASTPEETKALRKYLLGLALVAATTDIDLFLREGCHLRYIGDEQWHTVARRGNPEPIDMTSDAAKQVITSFASAAADPFRGKWSEAIGESMEFKFDLKLAKEQLKKKGEDEDQPAS